MFRIFVDTCVWRHWFTYRSGGGSDMPTRLSQHCDHFQIIYDRVVAVPTHARFLYNQLVKDELGNSFEDDFVAKVLPVSEKIPIPLTRFDGAYRYGDSILHGGELGGTLRALLSMYGYPHEEALKQAADALTEGKFLYETTARKKEFDIEHMESALEARAHLFLTDDESTILKRLRDASPKYHEAHPINAICRIAMTPTEAAHIQW